MGIVEENKLSEAEVALLRTQKLPRAFSPHAPIESEALFSGRLQQRNRTVQAILQRGQHVILFGKRGVGKSSMANTLEQYLVSSSSGLNTEKSNFLVAKINCDRATDFSSIWRRMLSKIDRRTTRVVGMPGNELAGNLAGNLADSLNANPSPGDIADILDDAKDVAPRIVLIFDEFETCKEEVKAAFTDLIKSLSDYTIHATIILVGVAETVAELISHHASIERSLMQVEMPPMSDTELTQIIKNAEHETGLVYDAFVTETIIRLSQGMPFITHLIGLASAEAAVNDYSRSVTPAHFSAAVVSAVDNIPGSLKDAYDKATMSVRSDATFDLILLAAAIVHWTIRGPFRPTDIVETLSFLRKKNVPSSNFSRQLRLLCDEDHGSILKSIGEEGSPRYQFSDPLQAIYTLLRGLKNGTLNNNDLMRLGKSTLINSRRKSAVGSRT